VARDDLEDLLDRRIAELEADRRLEGLRQRRLAGRRGASFVGGASSWRAGSWLGRSVRIAPSFWRAAS
jgi:hypothetical protein